MSVLLPHWVLAPVRQARCPPIHSRCWGVVSVAFSWSARPEAYRCCDLVKESAFGLIDLMHIFLFLILLISVLYHFLSSACLILNLLPFNFLG